MKLSDLSIRAKLLGGFGLVLGLALVLGLVAFYEMRQINDKSTEIASNWLPSVAEMGELTESASRFRTARLAFVLSTSAEERDRQEKRMVEFAARVETHRAAYEKLVSSPEERELFNALVGHWQSINALQVEFLSLAKSDRREETMELVNGRGREAFLRLQETGEKLLKLNRAGADAASAEGDRLFTRASWVLALTLMAAIGLGATIAFTLSAKIARTALDARDAAEAVAEGRLDREIRADGKDELGQMMDAMRAMQDNLIQIVSRVRASAEGVATASTQIAQGNQDLSQRTEEQASALEETAASMEELGSAVQQNADNAQQANQLSERASTIARDGGEAVGRVVDTMRDISESSRRIADIISTIDGIAFQTNILALNAAVEAARAGEQGRGFAVVAGEVRVLAQRSAEAAKEIKALITASSERVEQGNSQVESAGRTMAEVVGAIQRVTDIMGEISSASREQSSGVNQVGEAVGQMDQVTQQNAALVEESAAAAESLKTQAQQLVEVVAVFRLPGQGRSGPSATAAAAKVIKGPAGPRPAAGVRKPAPRAEARLAGASANPAASASAGGDGSWETF